MSWRRQAGEIFSANVYSSRESDEIDGAAKQGWAVLVEAKREGRYSNKLTVDPRRHWVTLEGRAGGDAGSHTNMGVRDKERQGGRGARSKLNGYPRQHWVTLEGRASVRRRWVTQESGV
jgi:hypothetical protein